MTDHPARPGRRAQHVFGGHGGWISGPSIGRGHGSPAEQVRAAEIRRGDILAYDGRELTVTAHPAGAWYVDTNGERVSGLAIITRDGDAHWTLFRRGSDLVMRVSS